MEDKKYEKLQILIADDDLLGQKVLKSMIEKKNWESTIVSNGREVLDELDRNSYHVILLDIYMPQMDGFEAIKKIRQMEKERQVAKPIPIIAITAASAEKEREKCRELGINEYILKPVKKKTLFETINKVLNKPGQVEELDLDGLLDRIDGNMYILKKLIEDLISDDYEKEHLGNIKKYLQDEDYEKLDKQLHKFRGSISNFSIDSINSTLEKMSHYLENKNYDEFLELHDQLKIQFKKIKVEAKAYYREHFAK